MRCSRRTKYLIQTAMNETRFEHRHDIFFLPTQILSTKPHPPLLFLVPSSPYHTRPPDLITTTELSDGEGAAGNHGLAWGSWQGEGDPVADRRVKSRRREILGGGAAGGGGGAETRMRSSIGYTAERGERGMGWMVDGMEQEESQ